jgi:hypothetical protein
MRWTAKEILKLKELIKLGKGGAEIAVELGRTRGQVNTKSFRLGLKSSFRFNAGSSNGQWKGDDVGYGCLHKWVRRNKPQPKTCEMCGKERKVLDCANISGEYKRDIDDWIYLCRKCHMKSDGRLLVWNKKRIEDMISGRSKPVGFHPREKNAPRDEHGRYARNNKQQM